MFYMSDNNWVLKKNDRIAKVFTRENFFYNHLNNIESKIISDSSIKWWMKVLHLDVSSKILIG